MRRFRPGFVLTAAWAVATALLLGLGSWQLARLGWKNELLARAEAALSAPAEPLPRVLADPPALEFRRVRASGVYLPDTAVALGFLVREGRPGSRLLTAFRLEDGRTVLVDRGFVPEDELARALRRPPPGGLRELEAVVRTGRGGGWATPSPDRALPRWYALDIEGIGRHLGLALEPVLLVLEHKDDAEPFPRPEPVVVDLPNPHLGYAATWFGLALALTVFYILIGRRAARETAP
ncbi:MAG: SURF1 family protein [Geminicoccaceae bacterium]|nr:SURF1 family protein [Geminicoccaceae bacterium]